MPDTPYISSVEIAIVREYSNGRKVVDKAIVRPGANNFAQYGDAPLHVRNANKPLLDRIARAVAADNEGAGAATA